VVNFIKTILSIFLVVAILTTVALFGKYASKRSTGICISTCGDGECQCSIVPGLGGSCSETLLTCPVDC